MGFCLRTICFDLFDWEFENGPNAFSSSCSLSNTQISLTRPVSCSRSRALLLSLVHTSPLTVEVQGGQMPQEVSPSPPEARAHFTSRLPFLTLALLIPFTTRPSKSQQSLESGDLVLTQFL